jgi:hypothetical protein
MLDIILSFILAATLITITTLILTEKIKINPNTTTTINPNTTTTIIPTTTISPSITTSPITTTRIMDTPSQKTVRQLLEEKCPVNISETRNGIVYINPTNSATRDNYLFSGCNASNTCNTSNIDPISKNILDNIPSKGFCGAWDLGDYEWDYNNNKWNKK